MYNILFRSLVDDIFVVTNEENELIKYENDRMNSEFDIGTELFKRNFDINIHHNLIDCYIDICSIQVMNIFLDNIDFKTIRGDFYNEMINSDIYNYKIYCEIINKSYAARIVDWKTYNGVSMDIIERWCHPLTLDNNTVGNNYIYERNNIYKEDNVNIGRFVKLNRNVVLGYQTLIGYRSSITNSIIGIKCKIGSNVNISNCYIFDNVNIGDNSYLEGSIIGNNVNIGKRCVINR